MDSTENKIKQLAEDVDYYFSLIHGEKMIDGRQSLHFPLDKMMETLYFSKSIGESYGLEYGSKLIRQCFDLFNTLYGDILENLNALYVIDKDILNKANEIRQSLSILLSNPVQSEDTKPITSTDDVIARLETVKRLAHNRCSDKTNAELRIIDNAVRNLEKLISGNEERLGYAEETDKPIMGLNLIVLRFEISLLRDNGLMEESSVQEIKEALKRIEDFVL